MQESIVEGLFDGLQYMNQASITNYSKADISFYKGYNQYRNTFRRDIAIHIIQTIMLAIFLPIDIVVLTPGALMVIAISLALAASIICTVVLLIEYCMLFKQYGIMGYCQLARDTLHTTEERITSGQSQQACTSTTILHAQTGSLIQGVPEKTIQVYSNMAKFQIEKINQHRFLSLNCWWRIQYFSGTSGLIAVFVLMIAGSNLNPAQIAVLCVYLVLQAFCRILFLIITLLVAVSPIICVIFCFWVCCCGPKEGRSVLDVNPTKATTDHVVKCDGQCAICLMKVDPGDAIYQLPCSDKHVFHTRCLDQWTQVKLTCPSCRANLPFKNVEVNPSQIPAEVVVE